MTYTKFPQDRQEGVDGLENPSPLSPELLTALERLKSLGVSFMMSLPGENIFIEPDQMLRLLENPDMTMLELFGATRSDVRAHAKAGGSLQCAAYTKAGRRCRAVVECAVYPISEWVRRSEIGEYCQSHGGGK